MIRSRLSRYPFTACGVWLMALGLYFMFLRPSFLPEDLRYIGISPAQLHAMPGLERWAHRVFTVMGGFMAGAGVLTVLAATHAVVVDGSWTRLALMLTGALTVGLMSLTNFQLDSDFKWWLLIPAALWLIGLAIAFVGSTSPAVGHTDTGHRQ